MRNIQVVGGEGGVRPVVLIDGVRIAGQFDIYIQDGVVVVDGKEQGIIYGNGVVLVKSGIATVSPATKSSKSKSSKSSKSTK